MLIGQKFKNIISRSVRIYVLISFQRSLKTLGGSKACILASLNTKINATICRIVNSE